MQALARHWIGRCLLHLCAAAVGVIHGAPHLSFHAAGILRELRDHLGS